MIRREKSTVFLDATEETTVLQLKKMLEGIVKKPPEDLKLYNPSNKDALEDNKTLGDCGYKSQNAKAQDPATIGLAYRISELPLYKLWWLISSAVLHHSVSGQESCSG